MKNNKDTLKDLKFSYIRRIIKYKDIEGNEKQITIFNPSKIEAKALLSDLFNNSSFNEENMNIDMSFFLVNFVKRLTDITFPQNDEEALDILNNADIPLQKTILEIMELLVDLIELNVKENKNFDKSKLKADEIQELTQKYQEVLKILKKVKG